MFVGENNSAFRLFETTYCIVTNYTKKSPMNTCFYRSMSQELENC